MRNTGWWDRAVGYEVYVRSFCDSNGDGIGDIPGVTSKLDHLAWLGVDVVWLTPFFASPQADFGYDVSDYTAVEPDYGTLDDVDELVEEAHRRGMRVLADLVPNHTSDQHRWFRESVSSIDSEYRGYYHWRDPARDGGPPNNWVSHFGGPAWTFDVTSGQYYLHLFLPEQPDLNWNNPRVVREFDHIIRFWLERGLDGFRIDVAHGLVKNMLMPDNPQRFPVTAGMSPREVFTAFEHRYDLDQAGTKEIYRRWRPIADQYDALLLGEVYLRDNDPAKVSRYVAGHDGLHRAFYFAPMHAPWDPEVMWGTFRDALDAAPEDLSWALSSHDDPRAPSRFGGGDLGRTRALAYATLLTCLPGLPFLYQGDELGLTDVEVPAEAGADPVGTRNENRADSRDGVRTPMPWEPGPGLGFSTSASTWLPMGPRSDADTVAVQRDDPESWLQRFRSLLLARRAVDPGDAPLQWLTSRADPVIAFRRGPMLCAVNVGVEAFELTLPPGAWTVRFSVVRVHDGPVEGSIELAEAGAVLLQAEVS